MRLGKRGKKFLVYHQLKVWNRKERELRERIGIAKVSFLVDNPRRLYLGRIDLELEAQAALRAEGIVYCLALPTCLIYRIGRHKAPHISFLIKRLRTLHPTWTLEVATFTAVQYRLTGAYCTVEGRVV